MSPWFHSEAYLFGITSSIDVAIMWIACSLGSVSSKNNRPITLRMLVSITGTGFLNAKQAIAEAVYFPIPFNASNSDVSEGIRPLNLDTISLAAVCIHSARRLYPSPAQAFITAPGVASASDFKVGNSFRNSIYLGTTRFTCV